MSKSMRKITYYENILEFKENSKEELNLNEINNWQLCRTCLTDTNDNDVDLEKMSIMDIMQGSFYSIKEMLVQTTSIEITETENLPLKVCKECFSKITSLYYFSIQVRKADQVLIRLANKLKGYKDEPPKEYDSEEENKFNGNEIPEDNVLIEVEELYDYPQQDLGTIEDNVNITIEQNETCKKELITDVEKPSENKETLEKPLENENLSYDEISQTETTYLDGEEIDTDLKSNFSEGENQLEKDLFEIESSDEEIVRKANKSKKRNRDITPLQGHRRKQPRVTSPLLNEKTCAICQKSFKRQLILVNHVKANHPNSKAYKCRVCCKLFSHIQSLSRHMNIHKDSVVLNECEYCAKTFIRVDDLKRHLRIHTGERPYVCSFCQKSFQQKCDLKCHEEKHSQDKHPLTKLFECVFCDQTYTSRNGLYLHKRKYHQQSQGGEEGTYACSLCERTFRYQSELRCHKKQHSLPDIIQCDQCDQTYASRNGLNTHKRKYHTNGNVSQENGSLKENLEFLNVEQES